MQLIHIRYILRVPSVAAKEMHRAGPAPGEVLREARKRHGLSQERLAVRAGTTQSAISRIESGRVSPSVDTLWELFFVLGEDLELVSVPRDAGFDLTLNWSSLAYNPSQRVDRGIAFADQVRAIRGKRPGDLETWGHVDGPPSLELHPLLRALVAHGVDFVVIGGVAGLARGSSYPTYDLDIAYARDEANLERFAKALADLEVALRGAPSDLPFVPDARSLANGANFTFDTGFGMFDALGDLGAVCSYEELRRDATRMYLKGFAVRVASLDHLIDMKKAANRPKDMNMLEEYLAMADLHDRAEAERSED
jgi:transcriptional regulator with XRE-family HTH domain